MSITMTIDTAIEINTNAVIEALRDCGYIVGNAASVVDDLRDDGVDVWTEDDSLEKILDDFADFDMTMDWCLVERDTDGVLDYLDPGEIATYAREQGLVTETTVADLSTEALLEELGKRVTAAERDLQEQREVSEQHARQRDDAIRERDEARKASAEAVSKHPAYLALSAELKGLGRLPGAMYHAGQKVSLKDGRAAIVSGVYNPEVYQCRAVDNADYFTVTASEITGLWEG